MNEHTNNPYKSIYIDVSFWPSHIYTNGDTIGGNVRVDPSSRPQRVTIAFKGGEKCSIMRGGGNDGTTYREKPEYFSSELELFASETKGANYDIVNFGIAKDNRVELPFEFRFPDTMETQQPLTKWLENERFESKPGGLLPPSYCSPGGFSSNAQIVEYYLEAKLYTESRHAPSLRVRQSVVFTPLPPPFPNPIPTIGRSHLNMHLQQQRQRGIWIRTHRLYPDYDPNEGFRDKMKHRWMRQKSAKPYTNFRIDAECPSIVTTGIPVLITLSITHLERSKGVPDPPPVFLRRVRVNVQSTIYTRIPHHSPFSEPRDIHDSHVYKTDLLDSSFTGEKGVLIYDGLPVITTEWPLHLAPPFKGYGLKLEHVIVVTVWGECAGEKIELQALHGKLTNVVALGHAGGDEGVNRRLEGEGREMLPPPTEEDVAPPPYQVLGKGS